ncbi:NAD(P)/FAD-dependent oxidoreductase [Herpetosiphon geysericola]|uniref:NAD(P)/FAD-dependent oxidoreductase n=1 Tax=Herpetosiphon geysericola TaxID=70996 RepID=UPI0006C90CCB|nr:hypothetical protein [Herpetosiphon geysericola]
MHVYAQYDLEWAAAPATIYARLAELPGWLLGSEVAGSWHWADQAWQISTQHQPQRLHWHAQSSNQPSLKADLVLELLDSVSSTHIRATLHFEWPKTAFELWHYWQRRRWLHNELAAVLQHWREAWPAQAPASNQLAESHPRTWQAFQAMNALDQLQRIQALDQRWQQFEQGQLPNLPYSQTQQLPKVDTAFDLVYAGGGLGLLHATLMARKGLRVLVFDRHEVGCAHREWNISQAELERLVATGFISWETLEREIIMARYTDGVVRFHAAGSAVAPAELHLPKVLDIALDAGALLRYARQQFLAAGGTVWDETSFEHVYHDPQRQQTIVAVRKVDQAQVIATRLLIDAMGATSPLTLASQPFAGICPTVGTVLSGADHDQNLGDILISVADTQADRQLIWEGFPGRDQELTVYVFYYDQVGAKAQYQHSLLDLFEDYFELLPSYKQLTPNAKHLRPVFGYIPARHALSKPKPLAGVLALGDASAQQSPLTFCGFGSFVRNLERTTNLLEQALQQQLTTPNHLSAISAYQSNVSMNWVFSRFMTPWGRPQDVNELQNVFAHVLNRLGYDLARRFFQDQMTWQDYNRVVLGTLAYYPQIMQVAWQVLGWRDWLRWIGDWLRFSRAALIANVGQHVPAWLIARLPKPWLFQYNAAYAEWQAMGWLDSSPNNQSQALGANTKIT